MKKVLVISRPLFILSLVIYRLVAKKNDFLLILIWTFDIFLYFII